MTKNSRESVNFQDQKDLILAEVAKRGDLADMDAWREAFPDIEFHDVDEVIMGAQIYWDDYSPIEKAAYVAYMTDPQNAELSFEVSSDNFNSFETIDNGEELWACWFFHAFKYLEGDSVMSDEAFEALLFYSVEASAEDILSDAAIALQCFYHQKVI